MEVKTREKWREVILSVRDKHSGDVNENRRGWFWLGANHRQTWP